MHNLISLLALPFLLISKQSFINRAFKRTHNKHIPRFWDDVNTILLGYPLGFYISILCTLYKDLIDV